MVWLLFLLHTWLGEGSECARICRDLNPALPPGWNQKAGQDGNGERCKSGKM